MTKIHLAGLILSTIFLQSCKDDYLIENKIGPSPAPGTPVVFNAGMGDTHDGSRTVYGERSGNVFPIYWGHPTDNDNSGSYDDIWIYSPQSTDAVPYARFTVKPPSSNYEEAAPVWPADGNGINITTPQDGMMSFYAFYPHSALKADNMPVTGTTRNYVTVIVPHLRKVYFPSTTKRVNGRDAYCAEPDMSLCYMKAYIPPMQLEDGKAVELQFEPFSSALDITIPGPTSGECTVTGVVIKSATIEGTTPDNRQAYPQQPIAGAVYLYLDNRPNLVTPYTGMSFQGGLNYINVDFYAEGSEEKGFLLKSGQSLNFKVFLPPTHNIEAIDVEVHSTDRVWVKRLSKTEGSTRLLEPGQIHIVTLPAIDTNGGVPDLSKWMSELDDSTPINNLSIPGAYSAGDFMLFHTQLSDGIANQPYTAQYEDLQEQFDAGIRAFQFNLKSGVKPYDQWSILSDGQRYALTPIANFGFFGDFIRHLVDVIIAKGSTEFCILDVNLDIQANTTDGYGLTGEFHDLFTLFSNYADVLYRTSLIAPKKDDGYTVGDLRGKILLQLHLNGDPKSVSSSENPDDIDKVWNYGYAPGSQNDVAGSVEYSMISPLSNIQRLLMNSAETEIFSWDTVENNYFSQLWDADKYTNATSSKVTHLRSPAIWGDYLKYTHYQNICPSAMYTYYTETNRKRATVTPVAFGKIGNLEYTPTFKDQTAYDQYYQSNPDTRYDAFFIRENAAPPVYSDYPTAPVNSANAGLRWMHAYILWKNMKQISSNDMIGGGPIYTSTPDLIYDNLANNSRTYEMLLDNPNQHYWLHSTDATNATTSYATRSAIVSGMWQASNEFPDNGPSVKAYRDKFKNKLFVSTYLGLSRVGDAANGSNTQIENLNIVKEFLGYVCDSYTDDEDTPLKLNAARWGQTPLGAVYMPYVPNRMVNLSNDTDVTDEYRRQTGIYVRKLINMMIQHSNDCQTVD